MNLQSAASIMDATQQSLEGITKANGYNTDAGREVYRGRETLGEDDPVPALSIFVDGEDHQATRPNCDRRGINLRLSIVGFVRPDPDDALDGMLQMQADIKRALFRMSGELSPLGRLAQNVEYDGTEFLYREEGGVFAAAIVQVSVQFEEQAT